MKYNKWDIILVKFPFTDLTNYKLRPALVISNNNFNNNDNLMLLWIYWNKWIEKYSSKLDQIDLKSGKMKKQSYFRFHNIFSLHIDLIERKIWELKDKKIEKLKEKMCDFLG
jgi:mRNA interferase MazF